MPNAGLPDENGRYLETPAMLARALAPLRRGGLAQRGRRLLRHHAGAHPGASPRRSRGLAPRTAHARAALARSPGVDYLEVTDDVRPVIVGERTNVIGRRKFKELIVAEQWEDAAEIARAQVKRGAQVIDVCLANPDRDELADMRALPRGGDQEGPRAR